MLAQRLDLNFQRPIDAAYWILVRPYYWENFDLLLVEKDKKITVFNKINHIKSLDRSRRRQDPCVYQSNIKRHLLSGDTFNF